MPPVSLRDFFGLRSQRQSCHRLDAMTKTILHPTLRVAVNSVRVVTISADAAKFRNPKKIPKSCDIPLKASTACFTLVVGLKT